MKTFQRGTLSRGMLGVSKYIRGQSGPAVNCRVMLSGFVKCCDASLFASRTCAEAGEKNRELPIVASEKPLQSRVGSRNA